MTSGVQNPYTGGRKRASCHRCWLGIASLFLMLLVLSARGYHKRKDKQRISVRLASGNDNKVGDSSGAQPHIEPSDDGDYDSEDGEGGDNDDSDSAESSWYLDSVADTLGGAIEDTGEWFHNQVEGVLGEDLTHGVADLADHTLDDLGGWTEKMEEWFATEADNDEDYLDEDSESESNEGEEETDGGEEDEDDESNEGGEANNDEEDADDKNTVETADDGGVNKPALTSGNLQLTTWNVAAINNNPFEYWLSMPENPAYEELMKKIEQFIENPGRLDVTVNTVFTDEMFLQLDKRLTDVGWKSMRDYWYNDFSQRAIVQGFLKDASLGSKRLASMPDRITNTIATADGSLVFRPTVINMYEEPLDNQDMWWKAWESFLFDEKIKVKDQNGEIQDKAPYEMLVPIKKAKYPAITEEEATDSLPLQTLCGAIFDGILVYMMNTVSEPNVWQPLKRTIVENLNKKKVPHTLSILEQQYMDSDIIMLQEVSSTLITQAKEGELGKNYHVVFPSKMDIYRDQNSVILLRKTVFADGVWTEITDTVESMFPEGNSVPVATGDILAIKAKNLAGEEFVVASFHGDTNGLATIPVLDAIISTMKSEETRIAAETKLLFGLDANTYETAVPEKTQDVMKFGDHYVGHGLSSCWGDTPQKSNYTTYNARTYLQPQLNKACKTTEKRTKGDVNPKDFILFGKSNYKVVKTWKDNTGKREYIEDMAFPTLHFPSDHGILTTIVESLTSSAVEPNVL